MGVPKRKMSKSRKRQRLATHKRSIPAPVRCSKCGAARMPHRVCPACGAYGDRQVLVVSADE